MPREYAPQSRNEPTSHERIVAEHRAYLEQQAARSMGALVGDLTRITSGRDVALRLAQEHTDEPLPRVITTLDSTNPADQAIARQLDYSNAPLHITADNQLVEHAPAEPDQHRFLYSPSAKALLGAFDSAGLALTPRAHSELVAEQDGRYGNAYAWASREVFKLIAGRSNTW